MKWLSYGVMIWLSMSSLYGFDWIAAGGFEYKKVSEGPYTPITDLLEENNLTNVNAVSMWLTRKWSADWYPSDQVNHSIVESGHLPIFIVYWFADDISVEYIHKHKSEYFTYLHRIRNYLDTVHGKKVIVLNPEYNEYGVEGWTGYNELLLESKKILDKGDIIIGPCVGDFGDYSRNSDVKNWKKFDPSLNKAIASFDFIAFQEMRSLTKNKPSDIVSLPKRIEYFSEYLHTVYKKPVFLAYLALSTWGKDADLIQAEVLQKLSERQLVLQAKGLMGINLFHLVDVPNHEGYFEEGEKYFGLFHSNFLPKESVAPFKRLRLIKKGKL